MTNPTSTRPGQITQLPVTHELRRAHDNSVISAHCCADCARSALRRLSLAQMMGGENQPGPLERIEAHVVDLATGEPGIFTWGLVPLDGLPPAEIHNYPGDLYDDLP